MSIAPPTAIIDHRHLYMYRSNWRVIISKRSLVEAGKFSHILFSVLFLFYASDVSVERIVAMVC
jgi:hypothetical protein